MMEVIITDSYLKILTGQCIIDIISFLQLLSSLRRELHFSSGNSIVRYVSLLIS
jgi:hypothetical protein